VVCVLTAYSVLGSFSWIANAAAPVPDGLRFSGRVEMDYFNNEGGVHWQKTNHFTMDVGKDCQYIVRLVDHDDSISDYIEVGYDGTNSFYLNNMSESIGKRVKESEQEIKPENEQMNVANNIATGLVRKSPVPQFSFASCADPVWMSYASGCVLGAISSGDQSSPASSKTGANGAPLNPNMFVQFKTIFSNDTEGLLNELSYVHPEKDLSSGAALNSAFPFGFTNTVYRLTARDYYGTNKIPYIKEASMDLFFLKRKPGNLRRLQKRASYKLICTNVQETTRINFKPDVPGITSIADERFNNADLGSHHFSYLATNNWLADTEVKKLPQFKNSFVVNQVYRNNINYQWIMLIIIFGSLTLCAYAAWKSMIRRSESGVDKNNIYCE
jgi:hypothetical protein